MGASTRILIVTALIVIVVVCSCPSHVTAEDPYIFLEWHVTYGQVAPLGVAKEGILINGQFPGPKINSTTNNNVVINVFNELTEPLMFTWHGIQQRLNCWLDGTPGTMCPIEPRTNYTYHFQPKDQIGSYFYYPILGLHRASGGFGLFQVNSRDLIPVPFDPPADDFAIVLGDWYNRSHRFLKWLLDKGSSIGHPNGLHINGKSHKVEEPAKEPLFTVNAGKVYRFRICNVGLKLSVNFRFQGHGMRLVEMEGSHTVQNRYECLDLHVGQCLSVLVKADQPPKDYYLVASSRFDKKRLETVGIIRYAGGSGPPSPKLPPPPPDGTTGVAWSINQFRSFRWDLTASAARPNPQGSYKYGKIKIARTMKIQNAQSEVNLKLRFSINGVSHVDLETPLKLAEYFGMASKVFKYDLVKDETPPPGKNPPVLAPSVVNATFKSFVEIIFQNNEKSIQTWHLDGYSFFAVAIEPGKWNPSKRVNYNLLDAVSRHTIQVYPQSWAAVLLALDNAGMWNLRSEMRERSYLGQQLYLSVLSPKKSLRDERNIPERQQLCGIVKGLPKPHPYS